MAKRRKLSRLKKQTYLYYSLVGAAVIGALFLIKKGSSLARIDWFSKGFKIQGGKLFYRVEIINPGSAPATINNVFLTFYKDNYLLGKVFFNTNTTIPANNMVVANIPVDVAPVGILLLIKDLIQNIKAPIPLRISGGIKVDNINIPIDEKLSINPTDYIS